MRVPSLAFVVTAAMPALLLAGCTRSTGHDGPDFDVEVYSESSEPAQLRFTATMEDGTMVADWTANVPPGRSVLGHVRGPPGTYTVRAEVVHAQDDWGPAPFGETTRCAILVANLEVAIGCTG